MLNRKTNLTAALMFMCACTAAANAGDIFRITATDTGSSPISPVTITGNSIIDIVEAGINTTGSLAGFQSRDTSLSLQYGNVANAIVVTKNAGNTTATLSFPGTGIPTRTFTGTSQADLENQIEDYLKKNGSADLKQFLKSMNQRSFIAVSDGNPNATTARFAQFAFDQFGMHDSLSRPPVDETGERAKSPFEFRVDARGGTYEAGDFSGNTFSLGLSSRYDWTKRVGTSLSFFGAYQQIEEADVFHAGVQLGVPIRIILPTDTQHFTWQLTPHAVLGGGGSEQLGAGGAIYGGGGTSLLSFDYLRWTFSMANQITFYKGQKLSFGDFELDPGVSQTILKNGLRADYRFNGNFSAFAGIAYSNFLDDAAIKNYFSPSIGIAWKRGGGTTFEIGYAGDFGSNYHAHQLRGGMNFAF
jgi:hypothetical protein